MVHTMAEGGCWFKHLPLPLYQAQTLLAIVTLGVFLFTRFRASNPDGVKPRGGVSLTKATDKEGRLAFCQPSPKPPAVVATAPLVCVHGSGTRGMVCRQLDLGA